MAEAIPEKELLEHEKIPQIIPEQGPDTTIEEQDLFEILGNEVEIQEAAFVELDPRPELQAQAQQAKEQAQQEIVALQQATQDLRQVDLGGEVGAAAGEIIAENQNLPTEQISTEEKPIFGMDPNQKATRAEVQGLPSNELYAKAQTASKPDTDLEAGLNAAKENWEENRDQYREPISADDISEDFAGGKEFIGQAAPQTLEEATDVIRKSVRTLGEAARVIGENKDIEDAEIIEEEILVNREKPQVEPEAPIDGIEGETVIDARDKFPGPQTEPTEPQEIAQIEYKKPVEETKQEAPEAEVEEIELTEPEPFVGREDTQINIETEEVKPEIIEPIPYTPSKEKSENTPYSDQEMATDELTGVTSRETVDNIQARLEAGQELTDAEANLMQGVRDGEIEQRTDISTPGTQPEELVTSAEEPIEEIKLTEPEPFANRAETSIEQQNVETESSVETNLEIEEAPDQEPSTTAERFPGFDGQYHETLREKIGKLAPDTVRIVEGLYARAKFDTIDRFAIWGNQKYINLKTSRATKRATKLAKIDQEIARLQGAINRQGLGSRFGIQESAKTTQERDTQSKKAESKIEKLELKRAKLQTKIEGITDARGEKIDRRDQIAERYVERMETQIAPHRSRLERLTEQKEQFDSEVENNQQKINEVTARITDLESAMNAEFVTKSERRDIKDAIANARGEIKQFKQVIKSRTKDRARVESKMIPVKRKMNKWTAQKSAGVRVTNRKTKEFNVGERRNPELNSNSTPEVAFEGKTTITGRELEAKWNELFQSEMPAVSKIFGEALGPQYNDAEHGLSFENAEHAFIEYAQLLKKEQYHTISERKIRKNLRLIFSSAQMEQ